jgi:hypothetical protein
MTERSTVAGDVVYPWCLAVVAVLPLGLRETANNQVGAYTVRTGSMVADSRMPGMAEVSASVRCTGFQRAELHTAVRWAEAATSRGVAGIHIRIRIHIRIHIREDVSRAAAECAGTAAGRWRRRGR